MAVNTESESESSRPVIGLIGMGEMGKMYAEALSKAGGGSIIHVCDLPSKYDQLVEYCKGKQGLVPMLDGHHVSRSSDFIVYSVEAEYLDAVVKQYGPSTKMGAIVAGQTSVKAPERAAFDKHLPSDVKIVSIHSLHGPTVSPEGQALVSRQSLTYPNESPLLIDRYYRSQIIIQHRASQEEVRLVEKILAPLKSRYVHLTYDEHDEVTANTQAVTHAAFLTMGTAWRCMQSFPWETGRYIGGIEVVKINIALRIYAAKWHVYAGLAILNPTAKKQIKQYAQSVSELFKLMINGREDELRKRVFAGRDSVFTRNADGNSPAPILLSDKALDKFEIGAPEANPAPRANSHLSLLAMVDCWHALKIRPFDHLAIGATPVFRFWIGVAEYLFRSDERLEDAIHAAVNDITHRSDDAEFLVAARGWSECVGYGHFEAYRLRFEETAKFFEPRFEESRKQNAAMFKFLAEEPVRTAQGKVESSSS